MGLIRSVKVGKEPLVLGRGNNSYGSDVRPSVRVDAPSTNPYSETLPDDTAPDKENTGQDAESSLQADQGIDSHAAIMRDAVEQIDEEYRLRKEREIDHARDEARRSAHEEGFNAGYEEGCTKGQEELAETIEQLKRLLNSVSNNQSEAINSLDDIAIEIVFEAVTKILGEKIACRKGIKAVIEEVIKKAGDRSVLVAHISPDDYRLLSRHEEELTGTNPNIHGIELRPDERVELGGCLLEMEGGSLDGRLEVQLQQLKETLLLARGRPTGVEPE